MESGPWPPPPLKSGYSLEKYNTYCKVYENYEKKKQEYDDFEDYWDKWNMKIYRSWRKNINGYDPKPCFDRRYNRN